MTRAQNDYDDIPGTFVFDAQVHAPSGDPETVEMGQLLALRVRSWKAVYGRAG